MVRVAPGVEVPDDELRLRFSRSGGPGGQHVNTSDTAVELRWHLGASGGLTDGQKSLVRERIRHRLTDADELVLRADEYRSQTRNREAAVARFSALLGEALRPVRPRRPTRPSRAANERRLEDKRRRAARKAHRRGDW